MFNTVPFEYQCCVHVIEVYCLLNPYAPLLPAQHNSVASADVCCVMWLLPSLLILALVSSSQQTITIEQGRKVANKSLEKYTDEDVFTDRYANFPKDNKISGYLWLWESFPNNTCQYITPLPSSVKINSSKWFALVEVKEDFGDCTSAMLDNVRNAGFDLIVSYSNSSSIPSVPKSLRNSQFPVVAISKKYASTLWDVAATDTLSDAVLVKVTVEDLDVAVVAIIMGTGMLFLCSCVTLCCLMFFIYRNRRGQYPVHSRHIHDEAFHQRYVQARMARQELIENILRQLQELQGEHRIPLGEEDTKALPLGSSLNHYESPRQRKIVLFVSRSFRKMIRLVSFLVTTSSTQTASTHG